MSAMRSASSNTTVVDVVEPYVAPLNQVLQAPGARHHDVDALLQGAHLLAVASATEDRHDALAVCPEQVAQDLVHLRGQLAGRHEHERLGAPRERALGVHDERNAEGQRLAGPRRCLATDVPPGERSRDGGGLDGQRLGDPLAGEYVGARRGDAKV